MESADQPSAGSPLPAPPPELESPLKFIFFNQRELRAGWRLLIYLLMAVAIGYILGQIARLFFKGIPSAITPTFVIAQECVLVLIVLIPAWIMGNIEGRTVADYGLPVRRAFGRNFWWGVAWGIASLTLVLLALRINGSFLFGEVGLGWPDALRYGTLWALAMYLVGVGEEFMLRGYTQYTLTTGFSVWGAGVGFWIAAALLSVLFAALHIGNPGETPLGIGNVVLIALFFAFTLYRTGTLWFAIGMHASWNWGQTFLYGVPNSGMVAQGHLLNPTIQGPWWYSGGTAGPEGSLLMVPLIALMFVVFDRTFPKGPRYPALVNAEASPVLPQSK